MARPIGLNLWPDRAASCNPGMVKRFELFGYRSCRSCRLQHIVRPTISRSAHRQIGSRDMVVRRASLHGHVTLAHGARSARSARPVSA